MKKIIYVEIERCEQCFYYFRTTSIINPSYKKECMKLQKEIKMEEIIPDWCPFPSKEIEMYSDLNKEYNCDIKLCWEDILNLEHCLNRIEKEMKLEYGNDFFTFTIKSIIDRWEKTIGKTSDEIYKENENESIPKT